MTRYTVECYDLHWVNIIDVITPCGFKWACKLIRLTKEQNIKK